MANSKKISLKFLPKKLRTSLMKFQKNGIRFAIQKYGRCLIGDEMGLGKTLQAIGAAYFYQYDWPLLIICPSSMKFNWVNELEKWLPELQPGDINVVSSFSCLSIVCTSKISIMSYGLFSLQKQNTSKKSLTEVILKTGFGVLILDESHYIRNRKSARAKEIMRVAKSISHILMLSGTPSLAKPEELYPQLSIVIPKLFGNFNNFAQKYCDAYYESKRAKNGSIFQTFVTSGASNLEELHVLLKRHVMIRRLKKEVLTELPPKRRQKIIFQISENSCYKKSVANHYNALKKMRDKEDMTTSDFDYKSCYFDLFNATALAKAGAVKQYISDLIDGMENKFVVFCFHLSIIKAIRQTLLEKNVKYICITGESHPMQRGIDVEKFQNDKSCRVALLTIQTGATGLTLTAADHVVFAELHFTPGVLIQAEDRCHRIGQKNAVQIHYLIAMGTIDTVLWSRLQKKVIVTSTALNGKIINDLEADEDHDRHDILSHVDAWIPIPWQQENISQSLLFQKKDKQQENHKIQSFFKNNDKLAKRKRESKNDSNGDMNDSDFKNPMKKRQKIPKIDYINLRSPEEENNEIIDLNIIKIPNYAFVKETSCHGNTESHNVFKHGIKKEIQIEIDNLKLVNENIPQSHLLNKKDTSTIDKNAAVIFSFDTPSNKIIIKNDQLPDKVFCECSSKNMLESKEHSNEIDCSDIKNKDLKFKIQDKFDKVNKLKSKHISEKTVDNFCEKTSNSKIENSSIIGNVPIINSQQTKRVNDYRLPDNKIIVNNTTELTSSSNKTIANKEFDHMETSSAVCSTITKNKNIEICTKKLKMKPKLKRNKIDLINQIDKSISSNNTEVNICENIIEKLDSLYNKKVLNKKKLEHEVTSSIVEKSSKVESVNVEKISEVESANVEKHAGSNIKSSTVINLSCEDCENNDMLSFDQHEKSEISSKKQDTNLSIKKNLKEGKSDHTENKSITKNIRNASTISDFQNKRFLDVSNLEKPSSVNSSVNKAENILTDSSEKDSFVIVNEKENSLNVIHEKLNWECSRCTFLNHQLLTICEMCETEKHPIDHMQPCCSKSNDIILNERHVSPSDITEHSVGSVHDAEGVDGVHHTEGEITNVICETPPPEDASDVEMFTSDEDEISKPISQYNIKVLETKCSHEIPLQAITHDKNKVLGTKVASNFLSEENNCLEKEKIQRGKKVLVTRLSTTVGDDLATNVNSQNSTDIKSLPNYDNSPKVSDIKVNDLENESFQKFQDFEFDNSVFNDIFQESSDIKMNENSEDVKDFNYFGDSDDSMDDLFDDIFDHNNSFNTTLSSNNDNAQNSFVSDCDHEDEMDNVLNNHGLFDDGDDLESLLISTDEKELLQASNVRNNNDDDDDTSTDDNDEDEDIKTIKLMFRPSYYTERVFLYNKEDGKYLQMYFDIQSIIMNSFEELPPLIQHLDNLLQIKQFVYKWRQLGPRKQSLVKRSNKPFTNPQEMYEKIYREANEKRKNSKQRFTTKEKDKTDLENLAEQIGGKVVTKTLKKKNQPQPSSSSNQANSKKQNDNTSIQVVDQDGIPLCLSCSSKVIGVRAGTQEAKFCSEQCMKDYKIRRKFTHNGARDLLFDVEQGVCQLCGFDTHALFERLRHAPANQRKDILDGTPFMKLPVNMLNAILKTPKEGLFWHADHINAVVEGGGECGLENYRTLCVPCHRDVTKQLQKRITKQKKVLNCKNIVNMLSKDKN